MYRDGLERIQLTKLLKDWSWKFLLLPSTSSSLAFFTPTSSLSGNSVSVGVGAVGVGGIFPLPPLSSNKLSPGKSPSQSQQSVSLGRSTAVNVAAGDQDGIR